MILSWCLIPVLHHTPEKNASDPILTLLHFDTAEATQTKSSSPRDMSEDGCHMPSFTGNKKLKASEQVTPVLFVGRIMSFSALFLFKLRRENEKRALATPMLKAR